MRWFHPVIFGVIPALSLFQANYLQIEIQDGVRPILASITFALLTLVFSNLLIKNAAKAALVSTLFLLIVFSYGHVYEQIENLSLFGLILGRHRLLAILWMGSFILGTWLIIRRLKNPLPLNRYLNIVGLIVLGIAVLQLGILEFNPQFTRSVPEPVRQPQVSTQVDKEEITKPDIYYIILDAYARDDVLQREGFNNDAFISQLTEMGFYVAKCSQSNYAETLLSLSSSLNMDYLESYAGGVPGKDNNPVGLSPYITNSGVQEGLKSLGYTIVTTETGIPWDEMPGSDIYLTSESQSSKPSLTSTAINRFEELFIRTTIFRLILEAKDSLFKRLFTHIQTPEETHYQLITSIFNNLERTVTIPGPKFVFAHIVSPHFPYVFDEKGNYKFYDSYDPGYFNNIRYVNRRTITLVQKLIAESENPPIIVIQGDHGQNWDSRLAILNAFYFPGSPAKTLYPSVSPVNTFRMIFDEYLGGSMGLLPDRSYFSNYDDIWNFTQVQYPCNPDR